MDTKKAGFTTISLPTHLVDKIKEKINNTGFHSPSAYVAFVLRDILAEKSAKKEVFSEEKSKELKTKLRNLGYL